MISPTGSSFCFAERNLIEERVMHLSEEQKDQLHFVAYSLQINNPDLSTHGKMANIARRFNELYDGDWKSIIIDGVYVDGSEDPPANRFGYEGKEILFYQQKPCEYLLGKVYSWFEEFVD